MDYDKNYIFLLNSPNIFLSIIKYIDKEDLEMLEPQIINLLKIIKEKKIDIKKSEKHEI